MEFPCQIWCQEAVSYLSQSPNEYVALMLHFGLLTAKQLKLIGAGLSLRQCSNPPFTGDDRALVTKLISSSRCNYLNLMFSFV
jgi:hypothetical protein